MSPSTTTGPSRGPSNEPIEESAVRGALEPWRVDADSFASSLAQRLAEAEDREEAADRGTDGQTLSDGQRSRFWRSPLLQRAAAILPPGFLHPELLKSTGLGGGAAVLGKKIGVKGAPALLAFPAVAIIVLGLTFVAALRRATTGVNAEEAEDFRRFDAQLRFWWRTHGKAVLILGLAATILFWGRPAEAILLMLLVSMVVLTWVLGQLQRAGLATRERLGERWGGMLVQVGIFGMLLINVLLQDSGSNLHAAWPATVLILGGALCSLIGGWRPKSGGWSSQSKLHGLLSLGVVAMLFPSLMTTPSDRETRRDWVESFHGVPLDTAMWRPFSLLASELLRDGGPAPDLLRAERNLLEEVRKSPDVSSYILSDASRLGMFDGEPMGPFRTRYGVEHLLERDSALRHPAQSYFDIYVRGRIAPLTDGDRDHVARRLLLALPDEPEYAALEEIWWIQECLRLVDRVDHLAPHRRTIQDIVAAAWRGSIDEESPTRPARAFVDNPDFVDRRGLARFFRDEPTFYAVSLMAEHGVPESVDLERVAAACRLESLPDHGWFGGVDDTELLYAATWDRLHREFEIPRESLGILLLRERVLVGCALLVILCVVSTLRAPREDLRTRRQET